MTDPDCTYLVIELKKGSSAAFEKIFSLYHKRIYNFCLRLLPCRDDAEETVQKVFVALWEQRAQLDEFKPFIPYLFSIARYMIYQDFRRSVYSKAVFEELSLRNTGLGETTKDEVLFKELSDILNKLVQQLPPRQKEIFHLSRDSGLTYKEIAAELGISDHTVDTQISRALDFLRKEHDMYYR